MTTTHQSDLEQIARKYDLSPDTLQDAIRVAELSMTPQSRRVAVLENGERRHLVVTRRGVGPLQTDHRGFHLFDLQVEDSWEKYTVLFKGELNDEFIPVLRDRERLLLRIDSGCETGQVFGDLTCECKQQLHEAMQVIHQKGEGMIINIPRQDGRGMGLPFKLSTLRLQQLGLDTVEAAHILAADDVIDTRTYAGVVATLIFFGITTSTQISLATNNPRKLQIFVENGYVVADSLPIVVPATSHTRRHLRAKQEHLGHRNLLPDHETPLAKAG